MCYQLDRPSPLREGQTAAKGRWRGGGSKKGVWLFSPTPASSQRPLATPPAKGRGDRIVLQRNWLSLSLTRMTLTFMSILYFAKMRPIAIRTIPLYLLDCKRFKKFFLNSIGYDQGYGYDVYITTNCVSIDWATTKFGRTCLKICLVEKACLVP